MKKKKYLNLLKKGLNRTAGNELSNAFDDLLLLDPSFQKLLSFHLYFLRPEADRNVVKLDAIAGHSCYIDLLQKEFTPQEITSKLDQLIATVFKNRRVKI